MELWYSLVVATYISLAAEPVNALFHCKPRFDGKSFDLSELSGPRSVSYSHNTPPSLTNTTWYIDPCNELDIKKLPENTCPKGSQICGVQTLTIPKDDLTVVSQVIPVTGDFDGLESGAQYSKIDGNRGVSVSLSGGSWGDSKDLKADIDFYCVDNDSNDKDKLEFVSWDDKTLKLKWSSPKACPLSDDGGDKDKNKDGNNDDKDKDGNDDKDKGGDKDGHDDKDKGGNDDNREDTSGQSWGWFTWLFILIVLGFSAYVVGSAWINYNRYGLSGVELLPHSDAVRDIPYLVRDFAKKIANTFAGGTSRGGYSAV
ncbi:Atg27p [Sugiyamaella lignohabitans]|uniref:Autophagy-related protein 27 n=1 Tax=Sugiyamaella lignohabitans TaxID=796027 RepID=A0A167FK09_9ASCO|nr:Atg27p [Sugiyamaella lignohabitans]ANB15399.1 Atg27p [Sugiyamaella lignohabitans]